MENRPVVPNTRKTGPERRSVRGRIFLNERTERRLPGRFASMDSLRTDNLDVRHPITAEVILNVFDKRLLVPSQPLGVVA
jgi:hypothetical protein